MTPDHTPSPAEIAGMQKDAVRYRWLRDHSCPPHNFYISVPVEFEGARYSPDEVDAYTAVFCGFRRKGPENMAHSSQIDRASMENASGLADKLPEGFIPHDGGPCPIQSACDIVTRSGMQAFASYLFEGWEHRSEPRWFDVIAYRRAALTKATATGGGE